MKLFREALPKRTCTKKYSSYRPYKPFLQADFNKRCGYCNDLDVVCGGWRGFHIDHFRPKSLFDELANEYSNLVYACPYCNIAKSNDWPGNAEKNIIKGKGYLDPCDSNFDNHFERYNNGRICPKTDVGKYMFKKLKLGLRRHQLAWAYEQLEILLQELTDELQKLDSNSPDGLKLKDHHLQLTGEYFKYKKMFEETL